MRLPFVLVLDKLWNSVWSWTCRRALKGRDARSSSTGHHSIKTARMHHFPGSGTLWVLINDITTLTALMFFSATKAMQRNLNTLNSLLSMPMSSLNHNGFSSAIFLSSIYLSKHVVLLSHPASMPFYGCPVHWDSCLWRWWHGTANSTRVGNRQATLVQFLPVPHVCQRMAGFLLSVFSVSNSC